MPSFKRGRVRNIYTSYTTLDDINVDYVKPTAETRLCGLLWVATVVDVHNCASMVGIDTYLSTYVRALFHLF